MKLIFLPFSLFLCIACGINSNKPNSDEKEQPIPDTTGKSPTLMPGQEGNIHPTGNYKKITPTSTIEVLTISKLTDTASIFFTKYKEKCHSWNPSKKDVRHIILNSETIDGHEFHYDFDILPCQVSGEIKIDGHYGSYSINSGASTYIKYSDTTITLGYKKKDLSKFFILGPGIE